MIDEIVGRRVSGVFRCGVPKINRDFAFTFSDGSCVYGSPDGDCCSYSWVEHINGVQDVIGQEIVSFENRVEGGKKDPYYDYLSLYGTTLITKGGHRIDIDYRNASNGYYGGWLSWHLHENEFPDAGWIRINEDF